MVNLRIALKFCMPIIRDGQQIMPCEFSMLALRDGQCSLAYSIIDHPPEEIF
jgi:hypothetical protein